MNPTIGADPEVFVRQGTEFISGHIFELGNKFKPTETEYGAVQNDGVALEFNTTPTESKSEFIGYINAGLRDLAVRVASSGSSIVLRPSVNFGLRYLKSLPPSVGELGCNPDWNAYTQNTNPSPDKDSPFRTGAGHVHIGWTKNINPRSVGHFNKCIILAKNLDFLLGLPSLLWDADHLRRNLYGRAGAFRPKPYGLEYRVPSNVWLASEDNISFVFDAAVRAFEMSRQGQQLIDKYGSFAEDAINGNVTSWMQLNSELAGEVFQ